jgi:hypothetical protein
MIEGQDKVGKVGFGLLDSIEREYGTEHSPKVIQVICVAEIEYTDEDGDRATHVAFEYDAARPVERAGLIHYLGKALGIK